MKRSNFIILSFLYFLPYLFMGTVLFYFAGTILLPLFSNIYVLKPVMDSIGHFFNAVIMDGGEPSQLGVFLFALGVLLVFAVYKWLDWLSRISHLCMLGAFIAMALTNGNSAFFWFACLLLIAFILFLVFHICNYSRLAKRERKNRIS